MPYIRLFVNDVDVAFFRRVAKIRNARNRQTNPNSKRETWRSAADDALIEGTVAMQHSGEWDEEEIEEEE